MEAALDCASLLHLHLLAPMAAAVQPQIATGRGPSCGLALPSGFATGEGVLCLQGIC